MRVKTVSFGFTKNLGSFQSARADVTVELSDGDEFDEAVLLASALTKDTLGEALDDAETQILRLFESKQLKIRAQRSAS